MGVALFLTAISLLQRSPTEMTISKAPVCRDYISICAMRCKAFNSCFIIQTGSLDFQIFNWQLLLRGKATFSQKSKSEKQISKHLKKNKIKGPCHSVLCFTWNVLFSCGNEVWQDYAACMSLCRPSNFSDIWQRGNGLNETMLPQFV